MDTIGSSIETAVEWDVLPSLMESGLFYIVFVESSPHGELTYWIDEVVDNYPLAMQIVNEYIDNGLTDISIFQKDSDNQITEESF